MAIFFGSTFGTMFFLLSALVVSGASAAEEEKCDVNNATWVNTSAHRRVTRTGSNTSVWVFDPPQEDVRILVTPLDPAQDPDIRLYGVSVVCFLVNFAQDYGGDLMLLRNGTTTQLGSISRYFLHVSCLKGDCDYHISWIRGQGMETLEEIREGETKSGVAYHGVPLHFFFNCSGRCAEQAATEGENQRLTISAWPRDATSTHHLTLLVRKDELPSSKHDEHLEATRGWFSGEVVSTTVSSGVFYITIMKRHGRTPLPFVLSVRMPETLQQLPLGRPVFGAVSRNHMAFFKFKVDSADSDIEVYLTTLDGDPDIALSHSEVHSHPTPLAAQWHARKIGDDEIVVPPDDPKRKAHPTGWFHIGVHGYKDTSFSLIVLAEPHYDSVAAPANDAEVEVVSWTELWLGLPQVLSVQPGRPANFLFFSQLVTPRLFIRLEVLEGQWPDTCAGTCGPDPHLCPYVSPLSANTTLAAHPAVAVSPCEAAMMRGSSSDAEAIITRPCSSCWYSILVTNAVGRSKFKVTLGAEGRAHPLVVGELFRGHVNANDSVVLLVYDLSLTEAVSRGDSNSTLRVVLTPIYGDPLFSVHQFAEDGKLLYSAGESGHNDFELQLTPETASTLAGSYFFEVWAASAHSEFRMQVSWTSPDLRPGESAPSTAGSPANHNGTLGGLGLPFLVDGQAERGVLLDGHPDLYLYRPANVTQNPALLMSVSPLGEVQCKLFVIALRGSDDLEASVNTLVIFISSPEDRATWRTSPGEEELVIRSTDPSYLPPGEDVILAVLVAPGLGSTSGDGRVPYEIEVTSGEAPEELPATGVPVTGSVAGGQYRRYRVSVAEANQHLAVTLAALSGDCDLYVGINASVSSTVNIVRSEAFGSDTVFIPAFSEVNQQHCSQEVISRDAECVYFVAVLGLSDTSEFRLTAGVSSGSPTRLAAGGSVAVALSPGSWQYFFVDLHPDMPALGLQVKTLTGTLTSLHLKVLPAALARHPGQDLSDLRGQADLDGTRFVGVWSIKLDAARMKRLCDIAGDQSGCAALIALNSKEGAVGTAELVLEPPSSTAGHGGQALPATPLEAGVPERGILEGSTNVRLYSFRLPGSRPSFSVVVTPLTQCTPQLQVQFAGAADHPGDPIDFPPDQQLRFTMAQIPNSHPAYQPGLVHLWVRKNTSDACEFDIRAQPVADEYMTTWAGGGEVAPEVLMLDAPTFASTASTQYFVFTSRIADGQDARVRERLEVSVTALAGNIQVACAFIKADIKMANPEHRVPSALAALRDVHSEGRNGSPGVYICRGFKEACGTSLVCQILVRVKSVREGLLADLLAVASDSGSRAEALMMGIPVRGFICAGCPEEDGEIASTSARYQLFVNNPSVVVRLRLACLGPDRVNECSKVTVVADSRVDLPANLDHWKYQPQDSHGGEMELLVSQQGGAAGGAAGACRAPCVLFVRVELAGEIEPGDVLPVAFELIAASEGAYTLLLDGADPTVVSLQTSRPEYFLFDSRHRSPLLTLMVTVPYDEMDPHSDLVSMYVLDCADKPPSSETQAETVLDPTARPTSEYYRYKGVANSRGQLVALITRGQDDQDQLDEGNHCYYRIALVSHRLSPSTVTIRGFDWQPGAHGAPLQLGEPLEGVVDGKHQFSFTIESQPALQGTPKIQQSRDVLLSLEVCKGNLRLKTSSLNHGQSTRIFNGGVSSFPVPLASNQGLQVETVDGTFGSFILTAEDPQKHVWLDARPSRYLQVHQDGTVVTLEWAAARLFGHAQPLEGTGGDRQPIAHYEVFYLLADTVAANLSTPCGLYFEHRQRHAKQVFTKTRRRLAVKDLQPGKQYVFNVVARSMSTGHTIAYIPFRTFIPSVSLAAAKKVAPRRSTFWDQIAPLLIILSVVVFLAWTRPCCKTTTHGWPGFHLELPAWQPRSRRRYQPVGEGMGAPQTGSYAPPAVVGSSQDVPSPFASIPDGRRF